MSAVFSDTGGLKKGDDVRVAGVPVGEVTGVHADFEAGQVIVNVEVDEGIDLGPQTRAEIGAATLLGGYYLGLTGPVEEQFLPELPEAERRIPLARTHTPVSLIGAPGDTTSQIHAIGNALINARLRTLPDPPDRPHNADPPRLPH